MGARRTPAAEPAEADEPVAPGIDTVRVPGGLAALATMARLPSAVMPESFFLEYSRIVAAKAHLRELAAYMASVVELSSLAEPGSGRINLSLDQDSAREKTTRVLALLGWKVKQEGESLVFELGDQPEDDTPQAIPAGWASDELAMVNALTVTKSIRS